MARPQGGISAARQPRPGHYGRADRDRDLRVRVRARCAGSRSVRGRLPRHHGGVRKRIDLEFDQKGARFLTVVESRSPGVALALPRSARVPPNLTRSSACSASSARMRAQLRSANLSPPALHRARVLPEGAEGHHGHHEDAARAPVAGGGFASCKFGRRDCREPEKVRSTRWPRTCGSLPHCRIRSSAPTRDGEDRERRRAGDQVHARAGGKTLGTAEQTLSCRRWAAICARCWMKCGARRVSVRRSPTISNGTPSR